MTKLNIALPSKGRMQEECESFLKQAGFEVERTGGNRGYQGRLMGFDDVELAFLSPSEVATELNAGNVHFGITGIDLISEKTTREENVDEFLYLGFSRADVVVAIPEAWIDVESIEDLSDVVSDFQTKHGRRVRIATKYVNLTTGFLNANGITEYELVESAGATEGAPAKGSADFIVDIMSTGTTLKANNLKVPSNGIILKSCACLAASLKCNWNAKILALIQPVLDRILSKWASDIFREISCDLPLAKVKKIVESFRKELGEEPIFIEYQYTINPRKSKVAPFTSFILPEKFSVDLATLLKDGGAKFVNIKNIDYLYLNWVKDEIDQLKEKISLKIKQDKS